MGKRRWPPLTRREVLDILNEFGFVFYSQTGSHAKYRAVVKGIERNVSVDTAEAEFYEVLIRSMVSQSGYSREEFYGATKRTRRKI